VNGVNLRPLTGVDILLDIIRYINIDTKVFIRRRAMKLTVSVCMGSSCYPRGNRKILQQLKDMIAAEKLQDQVQLSGHLCTGRCTQGPVVVINDIVYNHADELSVIELLKMKLKEKQ
jgi:NADH:ubiquinone oxidoreductase subunit E